MKSQICTAQATVKRKHLGYTESLKQKVKTRSVHAHDNSLMHAQTDIILNSFSFISVFPPASAANYIIKMLQFLFPPSSWMADHPSAAAEQTHEVLNLEGAHNGVDEQKLLMSGRHGVGSLFNSGGGIKFLIRNCFRCITCVRAVFTAHILMRCS